MKVVYAFMILTLAAAVVAAKQEQTQPAHDLYQRALFQERAVGDLDAATEMFRRVVRMRADDRDLAARALLGLGRCLEKQGSAEALSIYEQIVRDYPDQDPTAATARQALRELDSRTSIGGEASSSIGTPSPVLRRVAPMPEPPDGMELLSTIGGPVFGGGLNAAESLALVMLAESEETGAMNFALYDLSRQSYDLVFRRIYFPPEDEEDFGIPFHAVWGPDESFWVIGEVWDNGTAQQKPNAS